MNVLVKTIRNVIENANQKGTSPFNTTAKVTRVEGDTAWIHIDGGVDETPVRKTIDCKAGDVVKAHIGGGSGFIIGNGTAPPTDDTTARDARTKAVKAGVIAVEAKDIAETAEKATKENAAAMAQAVVRIDSDIDNLQEQIDGNITTWFYTTDPTITNPPASDWIEEGSENIHLGDLYYNTTSGYVWRWQYINDDYGWGRITDTDVTKALADAAKAQDTADRKRRVFYTTPVPPYDAGDLWAQGANGDLLRCQTAKADGDVYDSADWVLATKYTDDSLAEEVNQYFWHTETDTGAGAGAHITKIPKDDFLADPSNGGGNTLLTSDGMEVRNGLTTLAKFGNNVSLYGEDSQLFIEDGGMNINTRIKTGEYENVFSVYKSYSDQITFTPSPPVNITDRLTHRHTVPSDFATIDYLLMTHTDSTSGNEVTSQYDKSSGYWDFDPSTSVLTIYGDKRPSTYDKLVNYTAYGYKTESADVWAKGYIASDHDIFARHGYNNSKGKNLTYTGESLCLLGNGNDNDPTMGTDWTAVHKEGKYTTKQSSDLANNIFASIIYDGSGGGAIKIKKDGFYYVSYQVYLRDGFSVNDTISAGVQLNHSTFPMYSRCRAHNGSLYTTIGSSFVHNFNASDEIALMCRNSAGARGKWACLGVTRMQVIALAIWE